MYAEQSNKKATMVYELVICSESLQQGQRQATLVVEEHIIKEHSDTRNIVLQD